MSEDQSVYVTFRELKLWRRWKRKKGSLVLNIVPPVSLVSHTVGVGRIGPEVIETGQSVWGTSVHWVTGDFGPSPQPENH